MKVNYVHGGEQAFEAMLYKPHDQNTLAYINDNIANAANVLGDMGSNFIQQANVMYERFNNSALINATKAFIYGTGQHIAEDIIYPVAMDQMGNANLIMQKYIMANPTIQDLYHKNMCNGFQDTYFDLEPDNIGTERYDYQRVMDGVMQFDKDGEAYVMHYSNEDYADELSNMDKFAILETWDNANMLIYKDIDPTDPELNQF